MKEKEKQKDNYEGVGGLYRIDPKTGERVLVERTKDVGEESKPAPETTTDQEG